MPQKDHAMKRRMGWLAGLSIALLLGACAEVRQTASDASCSANPECGLQKELDTYIGMSQADLLMKEGTPEKKIEGHGADRYIYRRCGGILGGMNCRDIYFDIARTKVFRASYFKRTK
jgi:hypothetical protein